MLSVVSIVYAGILVDTACIVIEGLIVYEKEGIRIGRGCVNQILTLRQTSEKARDRKWRRYVGFMDMEKVYDRVN